MSAREGEMIQLGSDSTESDMVREAKSTTFACEINQMNNRISVVFHNSLKFRLQHKRDNSLTLGLVKK